MKDKPIYASRIQVIQGHLKTPAIKTTIKLDPPLGPDEIRIVKNVEWADVYCLDRHKLTEYLGKVDEIWVFEARIDLEPRNPVSAITLRHPKREALKADLARIKATPVSR
jgi:hypothetical protein